MPDEKTEMKRLPGRAASYWIERTPGPEFSAAPVNVRADVAVLGGGNRRADRRGPPQAGGQNRRRGRGSPDRRAAPRRHVHHGRLRSQPDGDSELVLVSGEEHKVGQGGDTRRHYRALQRFVEAIYTVREDRYHWMTRDNITVVTVDDVPYIGRMGAETSHLYVATGFKKWGMTHGTVAGRLLSDMILGKSARWAEVFDTNRKAIRRRRRSS